MILNKKYITGALALAMAIGFSGCAKYEVLPNKVDIKAKFADAKWDGNRVPKDEICSDYNKNGGHSPKIMITNLPKDTNKIILSFNDESVQRMNHGGHGVVGYKVANSSTNVTIPSIKGETFNLPVNFTSENAHNGGQFGKTPGAYLPPCSGGRGNTYSVNIEAIQEFGSDEKKPMLLGDTKLKMGIY
ncbi:MAG: hypothetical protein U9Q04_10630 [Campylobacterota bacterium]|nr:hypothetical protein [Campylobacterota bacterium]